MTKAVRVCSTKGMSHDAWLAKRREGIGGSDSPKIFLRENYPFGGDCVPELWAEKSGIMIPEKIASPAMNRGTEMEPKIAELYARKFEGVRKVRKVNAILAHPSLNFMRADVDRELYGDKEHSGNGILEIKCTGLRNFAKIKREGISDYYQIQLQHYLAVTGYKWGSFAVFNCENWELLTVDVERDEEIIAQIIDLDSEFWDSVVTGKRPEARIPVGLPQDSLSPLSVDSEIHDVSDHVGFVKAMNDLAQAKMYLDLANEMETDAKNRLKNLMDVSGYEAVRCDAGKVTYKMRNGSKRFDVKAYLKAFPDRTTEAETYFKSSAPSKTFSFYPANTSD